MGAGKGRGKEATRECEGALFLHSRLARRKPGRFDIRNIVRGFFLRLVCCLIMLATAGCPGSGTTPGSEYLLRVGGSSLTVHDFNQALEMDKAAYPYESLEDPARVVEIKDRLLLRMTEELVLRERARELGLRVSEEEVQKAVAEIKADYPDETFEETLLECAVSYDAWELRLKNRLIMEKVIAAEVESAIEITSEDLSAHHEKRRSEAPVSKDENGAAPDDAEERMLKALRWQKTEEAYQTWLKELIETRPVELNTALWEKVRGSD
ncbi:MAG: hypothetical protein GY859_03790 [Desulfobacterales bacterium]|nr:hypothetical protein [Desulfobacterales bacterium]